MKDKKRKIANSFRNTSFENKLSKIDRNVVNGYLKARKKIAKLFYNDIPPIIKEIYVISRRQFFNIKRSMLYH